MRTKKPLRAKEPVTIRFKDLSGGNKSVYLDIYRAGFRRKEYLRLYIVPARSQADREANALVMDAANIIKARRIREIVCGVAGGAGAGVVAGAGAGVVAGVGSGVIAGGAAGVGSGAACGVAAGDSPSGNAVLLLEWIRARGHQCEMDAISAGRSAITNAGSYRTTSLYLERYIEKTRHTRDIFLADVDKTFCAGFVKYLMGATAHRGNRVLSPSSGRLYYSKLVAALNDAFRKGLIPCNPASLLDKNDRIKAQPAQRAYLTAEELRRMSQIPCRHHQVKSAFLFSCMCGLRWSDIKSLTWDKVNTAGRVWQVETRMIKTRQPLYLPLSDEAIRFIPPRHSNSCDAALFNLPSLNSTNKMIREWAQRAGIEKHLSFHCARHTFATLMLTLGADLYTTSKLLGHSDIRVTQVYATIIDKKKQEAVNLTRGMFD